MKKIFGAVLSLFLMLVLTLCVSAKTPEEDPASWTLGAPQNLTLADVSEYNDPAGLIFALRVASCKGEDLMSLLAPDAASQLGAEYTWVSAVMQVDWALDDPEDWKYTENWDVLQSGHDGAVWEFFDLALSDTCTEGFTFLTLYDRENWAWYNESRGMSALFDGMTYWMEREDGTEVDFLDLNQHTVWVRARYVVNCNGYDESGQSCQFYLYSDWSDTVGIGKEAPAPPTELTRFPYPGVYRLALSDETVNGSAALEFETRHTNEMYAQNALYCANGWNQVELHAELAVNGGDWTEVPLADATLFQGKALLPLPPGTSLDAQFEVRVWYHFEGVNGVLDSEYSELLILHPRTEADNPNLSEVAEAQKCPLCGICNLPLGYCLFMWLVLLVGILLIMFVLISVAMGKERCPHCGRSLPPRADCCPYCGHAPDEPVQPRSRRKKQAMKAPDAAAATPETAWYSAQNTKELRRHSHQKRSAAGNPQDRAPSREHLPLGTPSSDLGNTQVAAYPSSPEEERTMLSAPSRSPRPAAPAAPMSPPDALPERNVPPYFEDPVYSSPAFSAPPAEPAPQTPSPPPQPVQPPVAPDAPPDRFVALRKCPRCGATYALGQRNCGMCGRRLTFVKK